MEYMTPNFTKDMVKTHKILIPNMAVTQFRLMQAALASEGYQTEVLGNCGSEVAQRPDRSCQAGKPAAGPEQRAGNGPKVHRQPGGCGQRPGKRAGNQSAARLADCG